MIPITRPWHKSLNVGVGTLRRDGCLDRVVFDTLNGLLLLHRIGLYRFRTCIDVDNVVAVVRGFGHEEEDEEEHDDEGTTHRVHCDAVRAVLDDGSSWAY